MIILHAGRTRVTFDPGAVSALSVQSDIQGYSVTVYTAAVSITVVFDVNDVKEVERFERTIRERRALHSEFRVKSLNVGTNEVGGGLTPRPFTKRGR